MLLHSPGNTNPLALPTRNVVAKITQWFFTHALGQIRQVEFLQQSLVGSRILGRSLKPILDAMQSWGEAYKAGSAG